MAKRKTVAFTHSKDFVCTMHHDAAKLLPAGIKAPITYYNVTGLEDVTKMEKNFELLKTQKPRCCTALIIPC